MRFIDRDEVARRLTYDICIPIVRDAMIAFSRGETKQLLRSIIPLSQGRLFGVMPGAMAADGPFGAKLISVFQDNFAKGIQSHQGRDPVRPRKRRAGLRGVMRARSLQFEPPRPVRSRATRSRGQTRGGWQSWAMVNRPRPMPERSRRCARRIDGRLGTIARTCQGLRRSHAHRARVARLRRGNRPRSRRSGRHDLHRDGGRRANPDRRLGKAWHARERSRLGLAGPRKWTMSWWCGRAPLPIAARACSRKAPSFSERRPAE